MDRFCASCGSALPSMNCKKMCYQCRAQREEKKERDKFFKRTKVVEQSEIVGREHGFVAVHTCIGNVHDRTFDDFCDCKKWIKRRDAALLVSQGIAVDWESRAPIFSNRAIVLKMSAGGKTPRSSMIEKVHIERSWLPPGVRARGIAEIEASLAEDRALWSEEERLRIDIFGELYDQTLSSLIRLVPAEEYDRLEREQRGVPVISLPFGWDERTNGGIGVAYGVATLPSEYEEDTNAPTTDESSESAEIYKSSTSLEDTASAIEDFDDGQDAAANFIRANGDQLEAEGD